MCCLVVLGVESDPNTSALAGTTGVPEEDQDSDSTHQWIPGTTTEILTRKYNEGMCF